MSFDYTKDAFTLDTNLPAAEHLKPLPNGTECEVIVESATLVPPSADKLDMSPRLSIRMSATQHPTAATIFHNIWLWNFDKPDAKEKAQAEANIKDFCQAFGMPLDKPAFQKGQKEGSNPVWTAALRKKAVVILRLEKNKGNGQMENVVVYKGAKK